MLDPEYNAHLLGWIPGHLKENVKIVVSTQPETHGILNKLQTELIPDEQHFVEVLPLVPAECFGILLQMLKDAGKCLNVEQQYASQKAFEICGLPLYIKLLFQDARMWRSYSTVNIDSIPGSVKEYINSIFDRLEQKHGRVLVSRSLAYLTASVTGLTDCEMEDILSLDNQVLNEVYGGKDITVYRLPPARWLALKHDISSFLTRKICEGMMVYFWDHDLFKNVVKDRYLQDESITLDIHSTLADYFLGSWHGKTKSFSRPNTPVNNIQMPEVMADRLVPSQPLTFQAEGNVIRFNQRKYEQVPRHLFLSGRLDELGDRVLFSYEWLYNKTKSLSLEHVLADFVLNPGVEATLVEKALRDAQPYIAKDINCMGVEITGRLLAYYNTHQGLYLYQYSTYFQNNDMMV